MMYFFIFFFFSSLLCFPSFAYLSPSPLPFLPSPISLPLFSFSSSLPPFAYLSPSLFLFPSFLCLYLSSPSPSPFSLFFFPSFLRLSLSLLSLSYFPSPFPSLLSLPLLFSPAFAFLLFHRLSFLVPLPLFLAASFSCHILLPLHSISATLASLPFPLLYFTFLFLFE